MDEVVESANPHSRIKLSGLGYTEMLWADSPTTLIVGPKNLAIDCDIGDYPAMQDCP